MHPRLRAQGDLVVGPGGPFVCVAGASAGPLAAGTGADLAAAPQSRPFQALVSGSITPTGASAFQLAGAGVVNAMGAVQRAGPVTITA